MLEQADAVDPLRVGFFMVGSDYALPVWWHVLEQADRGVALELTEFGCSMGLGCLSLLYTGIWEGSGGIWFGLDTLRPSSYLLVTAGVRV